MASNDKNSLQGNLPGSMVFGIQGKSAYQVAVDNGFVGTEEAWLKSLIGPQGVSISDIYDLTVSADAAGTAVKAVGKRRTLTIALSNGTQKTFYYYDGANGRDGCGVYPWDLSEASSHTDDEGVTHYNGGVKLPEGVTLKDGDLLLASSGDVYRVESWNYITGMVVSYMHSIGNSLSVPISGTAKVGQYLRVLSVDEAGKITGVEAVEAPTGGGGTVTDEQVAEAVADYLEKNPVSGVSAVQIDALDGMFKVCAFTKADVTAEYTAFKTAFGITDSEDSGGDDSGGSGDDSGGETEVTLTGISAIYSGGDVAVGTAVTDLTGLVVNAHYSDGSVARVTTYSLSGTIAEGENTITVTYEGMTTTFTVTGVEDETDYGTTDVNTTALWEVGGLQPTGKTSDVTTRLRTIDFIPSTVKSITVDDGYSYIVVAYDADGNAYGTTSYYNPNGTAGVKSGTSAFLTSAGTYYTGQLVIADILANMGTMYESLSTTYNNFKIIMRNETSPTSAITTDEAVHLHLWE